MLPVCMEAVLYDHYLRRIHRVNGDDLVYRCIILLYNQQFMLKRSCRYMCKFIILLWVVLFHFLVCCSDMFVIKFPDVKLFIFIYRILILVFRGILIHICRSYIVLPSRPFLGQYYLITLLSQHYLNSISVSCEVEIWRTCIISFVNGGWSNLLMHLFIRYRIINYNVKIIVFYQNNL